MEVNKDDNIKVFINLVEKVSENVKEGREVVYSEDGEYEVIGITSLLSCPLKTKYRKEYPEIKAKSLEIDEGFLFEQQVKKALKELYKENFKEELVVKYTNDKYKIIVEGHVDCHIIKPDSKEVINIELKVPRKLILLRDIKNLSDVDIIYDDKNDTVLVNDKYILQARIQKYLTELKYGKEYKVYQYLFLKSLVSDKYGKTKKVYVVYPIYESISKEYLDKLIEQYVTDKRPRYKNECKEYCPYYNVVCEGYDYDDNPSKETSVDYVDEEQLKNLIKRYYSLKSELSRLENLIKYKIDKLPDKRIKYGNREVGFYEYESITIDTKKLLEKAIQKKCLDKLCEEKCILVNWRHKDKIIKEYGEDIIKEKEKNIVFRI